MSDIYQILASLSLPYTRYDHPAVFTCQDIATHSLAIPGEVCKNLFLQNRKGGKYFLVVVSKDKKAYLKKLEQYLGEKVTFASPEDMLRLLGVTPGSVTLLGLIHDAQKEVIVVIDEALWANEELQMHPLVNTSSLVMKRQEVQTFLDVRGNDVRFTQL